MVLVGDGTFAFRDVLVLVTDLADRMHPRPRDAITRYVSNTKRSRSLSAWRRRREVDPELTMKMTS